MKEAWGDYLQRSAARIAELSEAYGMEDWITQYRRRELKLAGKTARQTDARWSTEIIHWTPTRGKGRDRGRPRTRWEDDIIRIAGGHWTETAKDTLLWDCLLPGYINSV